MLCISRGISWRETPNNLGAGAVNNCCKDFVQFLESILFRLE